MIKIRSKNCSLNMCLIKLYKFDIPRTKAVKLLTVSVHSWRKIELQALSNPSSLNFLKNFIKNL